MRPAETTPATAVGRRPRIFWFGMHKVLVQTEFRLLQDLGYEVFRPPYLAGVADQSVSKSADFGNARLPEDVLQTLADYNFFYNRITPEIGQLVERHFDAMIVTINADWLRAALEAFRGPIVFRCYGQIGLNAEALAHNGCRRLIEQRDNFYFMPHAQECLDDEASWLTESATVVPYWLPPDVLAHGGTWSGERSPSPRSIALSCPNITNPYYNVHFRYLKRHFEERCFRYYGVQLTPNADPNVVGSLDREMQLQRLSTEAGFLYTYRERNVCYLPPIEMMVLGGPVLFFPGSLLARYFGDSAPGLVADEAEAIIRSRLLMRGDSTFAREIIDSQSTIWRRYTPSFGESIFREAFERILPVASAPPIRFADDESRKAVLLIAHIGGYIVRDGRYAAVHGIPRVMRQLVSVLTAQGIRVEVTHASVECDEIRGFFASHSPRPELVGTLGFQEALDLGAKELQARYGYAIVAHYHFFPEANDLRLPLLAYVPDYLPHYFEGRGWFEESTEAVACGRTLVAKAYKILTNSQFSARYLPDSKLQVPSDRIVVVPLPYLGRTGTSGAIERPVEVPAELEDHRYIFYPTQPHPHKRLDLLVIAWLLVNQMRPTPVRLVLTAGRLERMTMELIEASSMSGFLHLLPGISDAAVEWLYRSAQCLAFSSELEGNFPTQVLEALRLDCPIVCYDIPLIVEELGELALHLQISAFGDVESFAHQLAYCIDHRAEALRRQNLVRRQILALFSDDQFRKSVLSLHELMKF